MDRQLNVCSIISVEKKPAYLPRKHVKALCVDRLRSNVKKEKWTQLKIVYIHKCDLKLDPRTGTENIKNKKN